MNPIRVLIVDDHPVIRKGITDILANASDIEIAGETASGQEALDLSRELMPDVILLDMELGEMSGIQVAKTLQQEGSPIRILALSAHNDREYVQEILKCGAAGYLSKDEMPELILTAVRGVAVGENGWISRMIINQLLKWQEAEKNPSPTEMTPRELQVLEQVMAGKTNQAIGLELSISEKTVEKYLESIFHKLSVSSRTEAAVWATRESIQNQKSQTKSY